MEFKEIKVPEGIIQQIDHEGPFAEINMERVIKKLLGMRFMPTGLVEKK